MAMAGTETQPTLMAPTNIRPNPVGSGTVIVGFDPTALTGYYILRWSSTPWTAADGYYILSGH